jgi:hypothetical protein
MKYDLLPAFPILQHQQSADSSFKKHAVGLKSLQIGPNKLSSTASSEEEKKDEKTYSPFQEKHLLESLDVNAFE